MTEANSDNEGLQWTGRLFGGITEDIKRRAPHYLSDFKDGFHSKVAGTTLFMFFAALANAIAFGALSGLLTGNEIGIIEMLIVTAVGGVLFALLAGQPLTILGGTGPIVIFTGMLYTGCNQLEISFLATYAWVGIWSGIILMICAVTDASALMRYFNRFTDEIFAALISIIFIVEAGKDMISSFNSDGLTSGLLTLFLGAGTYIIARNLKGITNSPYLRHGLRTFLSDFGPAIAIVIMTIIALQFPDVKLSTPVVPKTIEPTSGRTWLVDIFDLPRWAIFASVIPALLAIILLFLDQNITTRLVNAKEFKLQKGSGYHLDLAIVGIIVLAGSLFALPWIVAATVHSINHVKSLADTSIVTNNGTKKEVITYVRENRVSGLLIHLLIAASVFFLALVSNIPMAVLFGLFLYMGFTSLGGNQFAERLMLWITDPALDPDTYYLKSVPRTTIHKFTLIQLACFIGLWLLKASRFGIFFPLMIAALVPIYMFISRFFDRQHIETLVAEEEDDNADSQYI